MRTDIDDNTIDKNINNLDKIMKDYIKEDGSVDTTKIISINEAFIKGFESKVIFILRAVKLEMLITSSLAIITSFYAGYFFMHDTPSLIWGLSKIIGCGLISILMFICTAHNYYDYLFLKNEVKRVKEFRLTNTKERILKIWDNIHTTKN